MALTMLWQMHYLATLPTGYTTEDIVMLYTYALDDKQPLLQERLMALPQVKSVGMCGGTPIACSHNGVTVEGDKHPSSYIWLCMLDTTAFHMLGFHVVERYSEPLAGTIWLTEEGKHAYGLSPEHTGIGGSMAKPQYDVCGIVADYRGGTANRWFDEGVHNAIQIIGKDGFSWMMLVKTRGDHAEALKAIRDTYSQTMQEVKGVPKEANARYMDEYLYEALKKELDATKMVIVFTAISLLISALGLLAMALYHTEQQRRSSELREQEQRSTVKRLQEMVESLRNDAIGAEMPMSVSRRAEPLKTEAAGSSAKTEASGSGMKTEASGSGVKTEASGSRTKTEPEAPAGRSSAASEAEVVQPAVPDSGDNTIGAAGRGFVPGADDGWMDNRSEEADGRIIRRGAVSRESRMPFSSGLRPEGTVRRAESAGRSGMISRVENAGKGEPVRRGTVSAQEASVPRRAETAGTVSAGSSVMDDLVQMAASDDGVLREELFSIDDCLRNVMVLQEPVCAKKRIKLELKKSVTMPDEAIGDKAKLQRALVSLLETAAQQTPGGGAISLGCRADRASGNRAYLYFTIRDNGSSIASDLMQGMFEMKDEKDDPLRAGLYIAREIVSIMGGNVRVRSRRGEGTEFMVTVCMKLP